MLIDLRIPEVGESITEVQINDWLKSEGDDVKPDEAVAVIDSEKATFDLPSPAGGRLAKIVHQAGATVKVGDVIAQIDSAGGASKRTTSQAKPERKRKAESGAESKLAARREVEPPTERKAEAQERQDNSASGAAEQEAPEERVDKDAAPGAAPEERKPARETEEPAQGAPTSAPEKQATARLSADREEEVVPMTMLRRTVARRLVEAKQTMAMLTTFNEADMSAVQALREQHGESFEKRYKVRLGLMSFFVKAAIDALKQFPSLNAEIRDTDIVYRNYFDIGVAIATDRGLVVPVLRNAERWSFAELEKAISEFAKRGRAGNLKPSDLEGGTFTITNGGVFGSLLSTPIINPPQTGILGLHAIQDRAVAFSGQVVIRPMMYIALTYDHRLVDGRDAVLCLRRMKEAVESPARMLVEV